MPRSASRRALTLVLAAATASGVLAACGGSSGGGGGQHAGDGRPIIRYGAGITSISSMDPVQAVAPYTRILSMMLFSGLVRYAPSDVSKPLQPDLATTVPTPATVNGKQVWTVHLRHGVKCVKGEKTPEYELTSADVVYSLDRAADSKRSAFSAAYTNYASVKAVDKYTVAITLKHPESAGSFLPTIANYQGGLVVCEKAVEAEGDAEFGKHPVGTGPFMFSSYTPGQSLDLKSNDDYFRGKPKAAGWHFRFMSDANATKAALISGDLDVADSGDDAWQKSLLSHKGFKVVSTPLFGTWYLMFNVKHKPLDDVRVRKAIAYAVNRVDYVKSSGSGSRAALSVWGADLRYGIPDAHTKAAGLAYDYDLAKAKELMASSGHANGFTMQMTVSSPGTMAQILQAQLKKINITLKLKTVDTNTWLQAMFKGDQPMVMTLISFRGTPEIAFQNFFAGDAAVVGGKHPSENFTLYSGADKLINAAADSSSLSEQKKLWTEINDKLLSDAVVKPLIVSNQGYASVCGFTWGGAEPPVQIPGNWQATWKATVDRNVKTC